MRRLPGERILAALLVVGLVGCSSEIVGDDDVDAPVTLAFVSPAPGSAHVRDTIEASIGARVAAVGIELTIAGTPAAIELAADDVALGALDPSGLGTALLPALGTTTITATARDAAGEVVATASVDVDVIEPELADCRAWLDLYGATYTVGPARDGVADPVTITTPINGLRYRYSANTAPRATFFMDCSLALSLLEAAPHLRARGVVEVVDIGVYNYRCIGSGTPPDCPSGMSQHAYAKGIDIAGLTTADGTFYSVNDDWVIDPASEKTCEAATSNEKDAYLHEAICALKRNRVWNIVLTPNYNAAHRNHFHVDLTAGSDFIRGRGGVDEGPDHH
ncbi:MAG TPA: extensin family protein [Kofleriaceae bacterium]|nr:extensin family protein [Kofleriaceae bacterium]